MSHNLFMNWLGDAVIFMAHNDMPRVVDVLHNSILANGPGLTVNGMPEGLEILDLSPREGRLQMPDTLGIESRWPRSGPLRFTFRHQAASE